MTLWGEPEEVHVQKMVRLHAHDCHQNVTEHSTTSGHTKCTHSDMLALLTVARVTIDNIVPTRDWKPVADLEI